MLRKFVLALRRVADRERIAQRLRALDDRQLHDLGVSRDQIGAFVRATVRSRGIGGPVRPGN